MAEDNLIRSIEDAKNTLGKKRRLEIKKEKLEKLRERKYLSDERDKIPEKLSLSEQIFEWGKDFLKSKEYKEIEKLIESHGVVFPGHEIGKLWIYSGKWGHERYDDSHGCWSRFYLKSDGTFEYRAGYKWMGGGPDIRFENPRSLASGLSNEYIKNLCRFLTSGEVYTDLAKEIKENVREFG